MLRVPQRDEARAAATHLMIESMRSGGVSSAAPARRHVAPLSEEGGARASAGVVDDVVLRDREAAAAPVEVTLPVNEWAICAPHHRYIVETAGCGAIKLFVQSAAGSAHDYAIVFHSYGTQASHEAAAQIGAYILDAKQNPLSVRALCVQPYAVSRDVMRTVHRIADTVGKQAGVAFEERSVCLDALPGEARSRFVRVDLTGTEDEIMARCAPHVVTPPVMSDDERRAKIALFQSLPVDVRTPDFIRRWSTLNLEEARALAEDIRRRSAPWWGRILSGCCAPPLSQMR